MKQFRLSTGLIALFMAIPMSAQAQEAKPPTSGNAVAGSNGFALTSADGAYRLRLRGVIHSDGRFWLGDSKAGTTNTFLLRRVRPTFEGTIGKVFDFRIMPDFGGGATTLLDAYARIALRPNFYLQAGKFKGPVGFERLQSATALFFVERALPTSLVPNREVGIQISGEVGKGVLNYELGVFNGVVDGGSGDTDTNDGKDLAGRVFVHPFKNSSPTALKGLGLGIAGTTGKQTGALPAYRTLGQVVFFRYANGVVASGNRVRISPQGYFYSGPFGLLGEYAVSKQRVASAASSDELKNDAWHVVASWVLTGEANSYRGVSPKTPFSHSGGWGAVELAIRYHALRVDQNAFPAFADPAASAHKAQAWGVGFNWYLDRNLKITADYEQTSFTGGAAGGNRTTEKLFVNRFQISF